MPLLLLALACTGSPIDTADLCGRTGEPGLELGPPDGDDFVPFTPSQALTYGVAPQGGWGLQARVRTTGLVANAPVELQLESWIDGSMHAAFVNNSVQLFCSEEDDSGRIWGTAFPLEPSLSVAEVEAMAGTEIELRLDIIDLLGERASGNAVVTLGVPD